MVNAHISIAVGQMIFYAPMVPITIFIIFRNRWNRPKQPWYPLLLFSLFGVVRLIGGALTIVREKGAKNVHLDAASFALLNIGLIAMLWSTIGLIRLVLESTSGMVERAYPLLVFLRIALLVALMLLITSAGIGSTGRYAQTSRVVGLSAYIITSLVLSLATAELTRLHSQRHDFGIGTLIYVQLAIAGAPTLIIRIIYGLLFEFTITDEEPIWNPVHGSSIIYLLMCLIPEYMTLLLNIFLGFYRMRHILPALEENRDIQNRKCCTTGPLRFGWAVHATGNGPRGLTLPQPDSHYEPGRTEGLEHCNEGTL